MRIPFVLFACTLITSCAATHPIPMKNIDAGIVPPDFNPRKQILLVVEMPRLRKPDERNAHATTKMDDYLKKNYPYKYEIVTLADIAANNAKYADTSVYKYAVVNNLNGVQHTTYTTVHYSNGSSHTMSPSATTTYISYSFFDRIRNVRYGGGYSSPYINIAMGAFINAMKKAQKI